MLVTLGAAHILSPLGEGLAASVERMRTGGTALQRTSTAFDTPAVLGMIPDELLPQGPRRIQRMIDRCMKPLVNELGKPKFTDRWGCYIATTKGDIHALENGSPPLCNALHDRSSYAKDLPVYKPTLGDLQRVCERLICISYGWCGHRTRFCGPCRRNWC